MSKPIYICSEAGATLHYRADDQTLDYGGLVIVDWRDVPETWDVGDMIDACMDDLRRRLCPQEAIR